MGEDLALVTAALAPPARGTASQEGSPGAGGNLVDAAERGTLAGFAEGVSLAVDLLAATAGLGGARSLAGDLASLSGRVE